MKDRFIRGRCEECWSLWSSSPEYEPLGEGDTKLVANGYIHEMRDGEWIAQHRLVMQDHIGRPLESRENVHHLNGDRSDNRLENLELWRKSQPAGQRVSDLLNYAVEFHADELRRRLGLTLDGLTDWSRL